MPLAARASWGFLGLLLLGVSAYAVTSGATRLGLLGQRQEAPVDEGFVADATRALFCVLPLTASGVCFRRACAGRGPPRRPPTGRAG